jgi:hypothetical protein
MDNYIFELSAAVTRESEQAYAAANEPKQLVKIENANHIDLYDDTTKIPFEKLDAFFKKGLKVK